MVGLAERDRPGGVVGFRPAQRGVTAGEGPGAGEEPPERLDLQPQPGALRGAHAQLPGHDQGSQARPGEERADGDDWQPRRPPQVSRRPAEPGDGKTSDPDDGTHHAGRHAADLAAPVPQPTSPSPRLQLVADLPPRSSELRVVAGQPHPLPPAECAVEHVASHAVFGRTLTDQGDLIA
jgi:hypothetical protein